MDWGVEDWADPFIGVYKTARIIVNANIFIFPDLQSGNITYKMLAKLGKAVAVGPILMGMKKPIHVLQRADDVADIVNMAAVAVNDAQMNELNK